MIKLPSTMAGVAMVNSSRELVCSTANSGPAWIT